MSLIYSLSGFAVVPEIVLMRGFPQENAAFAKGVSACFSGIVDGKLLIAGGSNFPDISAKDGGMKKYYKDIYAAEIPIDSNFLWKKVGELPYPMAYGVSVSTPKGMICVGGINLKEAFRNVYRISIQNHKAVIETLPILPCTLDNMAGTLLGNILYVVGGNRNRKASNCVYCLDLDNLSDGWQALSVFPGQPRIQPVLTGQMDAKGELSLYLWGGFTLPTNDQQASMSVDGYVYTPSSRTWTLLPSPVNKDREQVSLGGGVATALGDSLILCTGGVHKDIFMQGFVQPASEYMSHPAEWYQFNNCLLVYNVNRQKWTEIARTTYLARAGATLVSNGQDYFYINGELKPGIRSPNITRIRFCRMK